jgi:hypothetical protein
MPGFRIIGFKTVSLQAGNNAYPEGYHAGDSHGLSHVDSNLNSFNIVYGVNIFGINGTFGYYNRYYPAWLRGSLATSLISSPDKSINKMAIQSTDLKKAYTDDIADLLKMLTPTLSSTKSLATKASADLSISKNTTQGTDLSVLVDGFVEETAAGVQTDHTSQAREATANDLNLCPMSDTVLDKIYIGSSVPFYRIWIVYGTAGVGNWTNATYYWNGAWTAVVGEVDNTSSFQSTAGTKSITHTPQGDWVTSVIQGMNLYWLMVRTDNFVSRTTKPLGTRIFVSIA